MSQEPCNDEVCVTCRDELVAVRLDWVSDDGTTARGDRDGEPVEVALDLVDGVRVGDTVLVHGGIALQLAEA